MILKLGWTLISSRSNSRVRILGLTQLSASRSLQDFLLSWVLDHVLFILEVLGALFLLHYLHLLDQRAEKRPILLPGRQLQNRVGYVRVDVLLVGEFPLDKRGVGGTVLELSEDVESFILKARHLHYLLDFLGLLLRDERLNSFHDRLVLDIPLLDVCAVELEFWDSWLLLLLLLLEHHLRILVFLLAKIYPIGKNKLRLLLLLVHERLLVLELGLLVRIEGRRLSWKGLFAFDPFASHYNFVVVLHYPLYSLVVLRIRAKQLT